MCLTNYNLSTKKLVNLRKVIWIESLERGLVGLYAFNTIIEKRGLIQSKKVRDDPFFKSDLKFNTVHRYLWCVLMTVSLYFGSSARTSMWLCIELYGLGGYIRFNSVFKTFLFAEKKIIFSWQCIHWGWANFFVFFKLSTSLNC